MALRDASESEKTNLRSDAAEYFLGLGFDEIINSVFHFVERSIPAVLGLRGEAANAVFQRPHFPESHLYR